MAVPDTFTDSTDWLNTPLAVLTPLDASLRCQVCKDYFTTPMITSCSHTFCSLCIRRYLSQEGRCPACRESDQEIKLRRNWSVEESVTQFKAGRDELLKVAKKAEEQAQTDEGSRPKKRRKIERGEALPERRSTRSQSRRHAHAAQGSQNGYTIQSSQEEIQDSDEGSVFEDKSAQPQRQTSEPHDGLVACPCCTRRMKETLINAHLDKCIAGEATPSPRRSNTPQVQTSSIAYGQPKPASPQDRLPTLNYSMLNDNALRRKLKELGIPNHGSKELMRKRHVEWVNLWNANCDSLRPTPKRQLLQDLDRWEKTLGRQIDKGPSGVMVKDFDRDGWQKSNKGDFDDLIRRAREKRIAAIAKAEVEVEDGVNASAEQLQTESDTLHRNEGLSVEPGKRSLEDIFDGASGDNLSGIHPVAVNGVGVDVSADVAMGGIPIGQRSGIAAEERPPVASGALPNGNGGSG